MNRNIRIFGAAMLAAFITLSGCSTTPERHSAVEQLRSDYEQLASQAHIQQNAARQLDHAEDALARAEAAVEEGADEDAINHYVYLADRRLEIVEEAAKLARAEDIVQNAESERQDVVLERREAEADTAEARADLAEIRAERLEQNLQDLEQQLESLEADQRGENIVLTLQDGLFITDAAELLPTAESTLDEIAAFLEQYQDQQLDVRGHTDSSGTPIENQTLSERRARIIRDALVDRGIDPERIQSEGYGADDPIASNETMAGRQQNRRVEIVIERAEPDRVSTR